MSNKPWEIHPVHKLADIASGADPRTQAAIKEWMDCYIDKVTVFDPLNGENGSPTVEPKYVILPKRKGT